MNWRSGAARYAPIQQGYTMPTHIVSQLQRIHERNGSKQPQRRPNNTPSPTLSVVTNPFRYPAHQEMPSSLRVETVQAVCEKLTVMRDHLISTGQEGNLAVIMNASKHIQHRYSWNAKNSYNIAKSHYSIVCGFPVLSHPQEESY